ncbi:hypothetical protein GQ457_15G013820 [Hibiscus cannabinus]
MRSQISAVGSNFDPTIHMQPGQPLSSRKCAHTRASYRHVPYVRDSSVLKAPRGIRSIGRSLPEDHVVSPPSIMLSPPESSAAVHAEKQKIEIRHEITITQ